MYIFVRIFIPHPSCLGTKNRSESLCLYIHYFNPDNMASMLKNNRAAMIDIIKTNFSKKELSYLNKYITQPEVKKFFSLAMEHKNFEKALAILSEEEKAIVNIKNPEFEASIAPKLQKMNAQIKSMVAYGGIDAIEKHKDAMEKIRPIDETCQMAHDIARKLSRRCRNLRDVKPAWRTSHG